MTNPLLYDTKRTLTSKSVLIMMAIMIILSLALIPSFTVSIQPQNLPTSQIFTYYDSSGYHFITFASNTFGQALSGVTFQINATIPPSPSAHTGFGTTNKSGMAEISISGSFNENTTVSFSYSSPNGASSNFGGLSMPYVTYSNGSMKALAAGKIQQILGEPFAAVPNSGNLSQDNIEVVWVGSFGSPPAGYKLYYAFQNLTTGPCGGAAACIGFSPGPFNESSMHYLGSMKNYVQTFQAPTLESNVSTNAQFSLALFDPNGTLISSMTSGTYEYYPPPTTFSVGEGNALVISFLLSIFGIFIPLMAIVGTYSTYGKDRVSGVLESVLAQPVSRKALSISRFISTFAAMGIATSVALGVIDGIFFYFVRSFLSPSILLPALGGFFVELAAFIGIMMLLSRVIRSSAGLIGIGIGLFIIFDFFWSLLILLAVGISNIQLSSAAYLQITVLGEFLNPAQFVNLIMTYITHAAGISGLGGVGIQITPSQYGVTIPTIVAAGLLWSALPLAGFLYLAIKKD